MKFLIDEDIPRSVATVLNAAGHAALDVRDCGLRGRTDEAVFEFAQKTSATILTGDVGFGNLHKYPLGAHSGIFVAHFPNEVSTQELNRQLAEALKMLTDTDFKGNLIVFEPGRMRIRRHKPLLPAPEDRETGR